MPGRCHVHDEIREPHVLGGVGVGAHQRDPPPGELGVARPDLLALEYPAALGGDGPGGERGQVRSCPGLAEQLAPDLLGAEDAGKPARLLLVGAVRQDRRPHVVDAVAVHRLRRPGAGVLHVEDGHLHRRGPPAAVARRPVDPHPAVGGQAGLPFAAPLELLLQRCGSAPGARRWLRASCGPRRGRPPPRGQCEIHGATFERGSRWAARRHRIRLPCSASPPGP